MIEKLKNGNTLITLGEGTVFIGNAKAGENEKPFGLYISNVEGKSDDAVIISLPSNKAIASYMMALVNFLEAHADEETSQLRESLNSLRKDLEPMVPMKKE